MDIYRETETYIHSHLYTDVVLHVLSHAYITASVVVVCIRSQNWSAECSLDKPPCSLVCGQDLTMCDVVWVSPQEHWSESESFRHRSDLVRCGNSSGETIVVEEEQSPVVGLWCRPRGVHWPLRPTSRILSIDCWCQLVLTHATKAFGMHRVIGMWQTLTLI